MNRLTKLLMAVCLLTGCGQKPAADSKSAEAEEQAAPAAVEAVETETADETAVEDADEATAPSAGAVASGTKFLGKIGPFGNHPCRQHPRRSNRHRASAAYRSA